jgi:NADH-quinone oxidoreductase subunit G/[NiFe] hydrogenase diaphorase moiety small subunit
MNAHQDTAGATPPGHADQTLIPLVIDHKQTAVPSGTTILEAARQAGIRIPTLCHHDDLRAAGACRLCVVEVEGQRVLQTACTFPVTQPLTVRTSTPRIRRARRHILELLLAEHHGECTSCFKNMACELQALAREYGVEQPRFELAALPVPPRDASSWSIVRDMGKCVMCRRCVRACAEMQGVGALGIVGRGYETRVATYLDKPLGSVVCINCGQCVNVCPTGALRVKDATDEVWAAIDNPRKHVGIQTAPSPRAAMGEEFGMEPGLSSPGSSIPR